MDDLLRDPKVVAWATIILLFRYFSLIIFDNPISRLRQLDGGVRRLLMAKIFALIPRQSRWGDHNGSADFDAPQDAARFSMLFIPVIVIFAGLGLMDLLVAGNLTSIGNAALAAVPAAATALVSTICL